MFRFQYPRPRGENTKSDLVLANGPKLPKHRPKTENNGATSSGSQDQAGRVGRAPNLGGWRSQDGSASSPRGPPGARGPADPVVLSASTRERQFPADKAMLALRLTRTYPIGIASCQTGE